MPGFVEDEYYVGGEKPANKTLHRSWLVFWFFSVVSFKHVFSFSTLIRVGPPARVNLAEMQDDSGVSAAPPQLSTGALDTNDRRVQ